MSDGHRMSGPHIIKLHDRRVQVQLQYHSPPKKDSRTKLRDVILCHIEKEKQNGNSSKKIHTLNSFKSIKKIKLAPTSPYYYHTKIEESHSIVAEFQTFHQRMVENQVEPRKLKVYSNSKQLKAVKEKNFSNTLANNSTNSKRAPNTKYTKVPLRKIKLYSPAKTHHQSKENQTKPFQKQKEMQEGSLASLIQLRGTPDRRYKLEVTSSKSRNKQDSLISRKQRSGEASKQIKSRFQQATPERFLKSFNSQSFNER